MKVFTIDGQSLSGITHLIAPLQLRIAGNHCEELSFFVLTTTSILLSNGHTNPTSLEFTDTGLKRENVQLCGQKRLVDVREQAEWLEMIEIQLCSAQKYFINP